LAKFYYGGQAVMEGVMMRGQRHMAVAVRAPDGEIVVHEEALKGLIMHPVMKLPFLRGLVGLWDALGLGMKALMFSANVAAQEEEEGKSAPDIEQSLNGAAATTPMAVAPVIPEAKPSSPGAAIEGAAAWTSLIIALSVMIGIFFVLPVLAAGLITNLANTESNLTHNLIEGAIRLAMFIGYIALIGRMRDIKRVFGYHGAEHKTINAYEAGAPLTPESVQSFTLLNPRCGTTFLLIVMLIATALFVVVGKLPFLLMVLSRIILVPVVATVAYEFVRLMANLYDYAIVRAIMAPGLALQKMTTRPPDLTMIEVAIKALNAVLAADGVVTAGEKTVARTRETEEVAEPAGTLA
jgi:uncharacterized protein YqhQ